MHLNEMWGLRWTEQRWTQNLANVWERKGLEQSKMFVIRVMLEILPFGEKATMRGIKNG